MKKFQTLFIISIFIFSFESPERVWNNPHDINSSLGLNDWSPKNLMVIRLSETTTELTWEYDAITLQGSLLINRSVMVI